MPRNNSKHRKNIRVIKAAERLMTLKYWSSCGHYHTYNGWANCPMSLRQAGEPTKYLL